MANLVHIKDIHFYYTTLTADAQECRDVMALLDAAGVDANELLYDHVPHHEGVFAALSTWGWGPKMRQRVFEVKFPLLHWTECYDDFSQHQGHAHGIQEIESCTVLKNPSLCAKKPAG